MKTLNFDYASATPLDVSVKDTINQLEKKYFYNPNSTHSKGVEANKKINEARAKIAYFLGAKPSEIVFTSGGSESNNLAIHGVMRTFLGGKVVTSNIEHESVLAPAGEYQHQLAKVNEQGIIDLAELKQKIDDDVVLVSIIHANNEIGVVQPIKDISRIINDIRKDRAKRAVKKPIFLHTDACQSAGTLDIHVHSLGVDLLTFSGSKIYGPAQTGALYVSPIVKLKPQILGGGQQNNLRSGTLYAPYAIGLAKALEIAQLMKENEQKRLKLLQKNFIDSLRTHFPGVIINGSVKKRLPSNINAVFPGVDGERLLVKLDTYGILASAGSACSAISREPSHVLGAIGLDEAMIKSSLRFSFGRSTKDSDIAKLIEVLKKEIA